MTIPPLHPIFVHVPLALIPLSIAADWIGFGANQPAARVFGRWCLLIAWLAMIPTTYFGYFDYGRLSESAPVDLLVRLHLKLGWFLFLCLSALGIWRTRLHFVKPPGPGAHRWYLGGSVLVLALTVFEGWYGGELVYGVGAAVYAPDKKVPPLGERPETIYRVHAAFSRVPFFRDQPSPDAPRLSSTEETGKK